MGNELQPAPKTHSDFPESESERMNQLARELAAHRQPLGFVPTPYFYFDALPASRQNLNKRFILTAFLFFIPLIVVKAYLETILPPIPYLWSTLSLFIGCGLFERSCRSALRRRFAQLEAAGKAPAQLES